MSTDPSRRAGRLARWGVAFGAALSFAIGPWAFPAHAAPGDYSYAEGRFLDGSVAELDLGEVVELAPAVAENNGEPETTTETSELDLSAIFDLIQIDLNDNIQLFGPNGVVALGAVNQYAQAETGGTSRAASGAVSDSGVVQVGGTDEFPGNATIDLGELLGPELDDVIAELAIEVGALSASAEQIAGGTPTGDYQIAELKLVADSPLVADLTGTVSDTVVPAVDEAVAELVGPDGALQGVLDGLNALDPVLAALGGGIDITANLDYDLEAALAPLLTGTIGEGTGVELSLEDGTITVDLAHLISGEEGLNDLDPNTELLSPEVLTKITETLAANLDQYIGEIQAAVRTALESGVLTFQADASALGVAEVDIDVVGSLADILAGSENITATAEVTLLGAPIELPLEELLEGIVAPINDILLGENGLLGTILEDLSSELITPLLTELTPAFDALTEIVSLTANVQTVANSVPVPLDAPSGAFIQRALTVELLPEAELAVVHLATAIVGPNETPQVETDVDVDGTDVDGTDVDGTDVDGTDVDGTDVDGTDVDGTDVDGTDVDTDVDGTDVDTDVDADSDADSDADADADGGSGADDGSGLPDTGTSPMLIIAGGLLLLAGGAAAYGMNRRKQGLSVPFIN